MTQKIMIKNLRKFIFMLYTSLSAMISFFAVLMIMIFAFTNAFYMSELAKQYADPDHYGQKDLLVLYYDNFKSSFRGLFGQYEFEVYDEGEYGIFYLFSLVITLLMLNILIAIVNDAY